MTMTEEMDIEMEEDFVAATSSGPPPVVPAEEEQDENVGALEDGARRRKERLRALKQKLMGGGGDKEEKKGDSTTVLPKPIFRSYNPAFDKFQEIAVPKAKVVDIEEQIADTLQHAVVKPVVDDVDLTSLAPRKPDWDLKRDVAPKLTKLERRTQKAIAELILDRLKTNQDNLAAAVEFSGKPRDEDDD
ncbi:coiled-coil domain-containing protein 12 [Folsomia candida]|uniref:Coiled-coil domain-containing protein 12 n=1 Tax=Folsomia candida TaxID=158441 RepID=A0A226CZ35_FOLCA|nr:coiled-coil domain-containing protein 12 [Folsomia candida]OXA37296.1 Coiled-coil domain-containing protein 12 [Folsomia candida]